MLLLLKTQAYFSHGIKKLFIIRSICYPLQNGLVYLIATSHQNAGIVNQNYTINAAQIRETEIIFCITKE